MPELPALVSLNLNGNKVGTLDQLQKLLKIGLETNIGEGGYMQQLNVSKEADQYRVKGKAIDSNASYNVVLPSFVAKGREANLGFLKDFDFQEPSTIQINGQAVNNDIRSIVIGHMLSIGSY